MIKYFHNIAAIYTHRVVLSNGKTMVGGGFAQGAEAAEKMASLHRLAGRKVKIITRQ
jgi:hypothetical protein